MNTVLKIIGVLVFISGILLSFVLPPAAIKVGDALKYNIRQNYATPAIVAAESPRYVEMHERYEKGIESLVVSRTNFAYATCLLITLLGVVIIFVRPIRKNEK